MTATAHALIGTVIAAKVGNPALAIPIALASHVVADAIPHWDTGTNRRKKGKTRFFMDSAIDGILGLVLSYLLIQFLFPQTSLIYAFVIIIAAQFFDWMMTPYLFLDWQHFPFNLPYKFNKSFDRKLDKPWGIVTQVVFVSAVVLLAKII